MIFLLAGCCEKEPDPVLRSVDVGIVVSNNENQFNNSLVTENITFRGVENITRYLSLHKTSKIKEAYINFSGYVYIGGVDDDEFENSSVGWSNPASCYDNDWDSQTSPGNVPALLWINYTTYSSTDANLTVKFQQYCGTDSQYYNQVLGVVACYNTSEDWEWFVFHNFADSSVKFNDSVIPQTCLQESITQLLFNYSDWGSIGNSWCSGHCYESNVTYFIDGLPENPFMEVGTPNGAYEWNVTGEFSAKDNRTLNFSTAITSALNSGACDCVGCNIIKENCTIPFRFSSDSVGNLEYYGINVSYTYIADINLSLHLDGEEKDRKYEYGTYANITAYVNDSGVELCIDLIAPGYGVESECGYNQLNISFLVENILKDTFSTGEDSVIMDLTNDYAHADITVKEDVDIASMEFNITGLDDSGYPKNVICDIGNDTQEDINLPGTLYGNILYQNLFSNNLTNGSLLFASGGSETIYMELSSSGIGTIIAVNGSMNLTSNQANSESYGYTQYYWNSTEIDAINSTVSNQWVFDNFSEGDISGRWSGSYSINQDTLYIASSCSCQGSGSCDGVITNSDSDEAETATIDITEYGSIFISVFMGGSYTNRFSGCPNWFTGSGYGNLHLKDKDTGSTTQIASYGGGTYDTSVYEVRKVGDYLNFYNDGSYIDQIVYDSSHQYELKFSSSAACGAEGDGSQGGSGFIQVYIINATGLTGTQSEVGDMTWDDSIVISNQLAYFSENLVSAKLTATNHIPEGTTITYYLTANNGTDWEEVTSGVLHEFLNAGKTLRYKAGVNCTGVKDTDGDLSEMAIVKDIQISVTTGALENITVDVGQDGIIDWRYNGTLPNGNSTSVNWSSSVVDDYIYDNCLNLKTCMVPIAIASESEASATYFNLDQNKTIRNYELDNISVVNNILDNKDNFTIQCGTNGANTGNLNFSLLKVEYPDDGNISVMAYAKNNKYKNSTYQIQVRFSNFTLDYPTGVSMLELIPLNKTYFNVTPYGQRIALTLNMSIPLYNLTNKSIDPIDYYVYINDTHDCINITLSPNTTKSDGVILDNRTAGEWKLLYSSATNVPVFVWADFYDCSLAAIYYLDPDIVFEPICADCVYPGDLNG